MLPSSRRPACCSVSLGSSWRAGRSWWTTHACALAGATWSCQARPRACPSQVCAVACFAPAGAPTESSLRPLTPCPHPRAPGPLPAPAATTSAYFEEGGRQATPAYLLSSLQPGHTVPGAKPGSTLGACAPQAQRPAFHTQLYTARPHLPPPGPAVLIDAISTVVVEPGCTAQLTTSHDVRIELGAAAAGSGGSGATAAADEVCDPIQLAIFSHRHARRARRLLGNGFCVVCAHMPPSCLPPALPF